MPSAAQPNQPSADYLSVATQAAKAAGSVLKNAYQTDTFSATEAGRDIKSEADKAAEKIIKDALSAATPGIPILAEESHTDFDEHKNAGENNTHNLLWIVDPLDGTMNFTRGFPICCTSIALWQNGEPLLGVIYDFLNDNLYTGIVGNNVNNKANAAALNGAPLRVSSLENLSQAVLTTGFPTSLAHDAQTLGAYVARFGSVKKVRMVGSAASALAFVATGAFDCYLEDSIWLWDVAAGLAIVKAAGGHITYTQPTQAGNWKMDVIATGSGLKPEALK